MNLIGARMAPVSELWSIGEFSRRSGLTPKALRLYDELDPLTPTQVDPVTGYRRYACDLLGPAQLVATLRLLGMPLARIRTLLGLDPSSVADHVEAYWRQVEADHGSRGEIVADLVKDLRKEDKPVDSTTTPLHAEVGVSHRQGAREHQQDAVLVQPDLFGVADGFGDRDDDLAGAVLAAFAAGGFEAAAAAARPGGDHTGTTLTAVRLTDSGGRITHVGDGRVHRIRDRHLEVLTHDHTLVAALVESGDLTPEEARSHPHRNLINRALAGRAVVPDELTIDLYPGDRVVISTDGVHAVLEPNALEELILSDADPQPLADAIGAAVEAAGAPDNHTVIVLHIT